MSEHNNEIDAEVDSGRIQRARTVSRELTITVAAALGVVAMISALGFGLHGLIALRGSQLDRLSLAAKLVTPEAITALDAQDPDRGRHVLATLGSDPSILLACLYAESGGVAHVFARFSRTSDTGSVCAGPGADETRWRRISLHTAIQRDGFRRGSLHIEAETGVLAFALSQMVWVGSLVWMGSVAVGYLALRRLRRRVSEPIAKLAEVPNGLTQVDFSDSLIPNSPREIGVLAEAMQLEAGRVSDLIARFRAQCEQITGSIEALREMGSRMAADAVLQEAAIEETGTAAGRTIDSIAVVGENVEALAQEASDTSMAIGQLDTSASKVIGQMETVFAAIDTTASAIFEATASIGSISECLDTLQTASDSTMDSLCAFRISGEAVREIAFKNRSLSERTVEEALGGLKAVSESIEGMNEIKQSFAEVEWAVGELSEQLVSIDDFVEVIDGVADESSLLALNAQIIAAQAGDQGRAFSVVAHEVRKLATQTTGYAKQIGELVIRVREAAELAVESVSRGSSTIQAGAQRSNDARGVLEGICKLAQLSQQMGREIESSTAGQDRSVESVSESMSSITDMVVQINRSIAEQARACGEIQTAAKGMRMMGDAVISATNEQRLSRDQLAGAVDRVGARSGQILAANRTQRDDRKKIIQALAVFRTTADSGSEHAHDLGRIAGALSSGFEGFAMEERRDARSDSSPADHENPDDR